MQSSLYYSSSIRAKLYCTKAHTHTPTTVWTKRYARIAWFKIGNLSTEQTEDESRKYGGATAATATWKAQNFAFSAYTNTHENPWFVHNLYHGLIWKAIISIFMHKRFLPRRLYHNPLERHRFFSAHSIVFTLFVAALDCTFWKFVDRFFAAVAGKCIQSFIRFQSNQPVIRISSMWEHDPCYTYCRSSKNVWICVVFAVSSGRWCNRKKQQPQIQYNPSVRNAGRAFSLSLSSSLVQLFSMMISVRSYNITCCVVHEHFVVSDYFIYFRVNKWTYCKLSDCTEKIEHLVSFPLSLAFPLSPSVQQLGVGLLFDTKRKP